MTPVLAAVGDEREARLLRLAEAALARWELAGSRVELLVDTVNATLRVEAPDGERYALRVHGAGAAHLPSIRSEQIWLAALAEAGLAVPAPVATPAGETVVEVASGAAAGDEPETRTCTLLRWVDGRFLTGPDLTPEAYGRVGETMARMHRVAERFVPPAGFHRQRWDGTDLERRLPGPGWELLARRDVPVLAEAARRVRRAAEALGTGPEVFGLIHGDLQASNFLFGPGGDVRVIDFADSGWGHYLYDVAASVLRLSDRDDHAALLSAFLAGYRRVRPLDPALVDRHLETFLVARGLYVLEWVAAHWRFPAIQAYGRGIVPYVLGQVRAYVERVAGPAALGDQGVAGLGTVRFLAHLRDRRIELRAEGDGLRFSAPKGAVTAELRREIGERKAELLAFLRQAGTSRAVPPVVPVPRTADLPLSFGQQRLWFLDRLDPGSSTYNIPPSVRLTGRLDLPALARSFHEVARRHEVLRTTFPAREGRPTVAIAERMAVALPVLDLSALPAARREAEAELRTAAEARRPFDLARGPLMRVVVLRLAPEEHLVLMTLHHTVFDGWSGGLLVRELAALYPAFRRGERSPLPPLPVQYADYAAWQRRWLAGEVLDEQLGYWRRQLAGAPERLELPTDRPAPPVPSSRGGKEVFRLDADLAGRLAGLARAEGATLFMVLLAGWKALLARYSGQDDVVVGTPIAGRNRPEVEGLIGFFVNTLALRSRVPEGGLRALLAEVRRVTLEAYGHQDLPFEKLVEELRPSRDLSLPPLFRVLFVLQNQPMPELTAEGLTFRFQVPRTGSAMFDLTLSMREAADGTLTGSLSYRHDLFDAATVRRILRHFERLLAAGAAEPDRPLAALPWMDEAERRQVVAGWNATAREYAGPEVLTDRLAAQAAATPEATALICADERLTYAEFEARVCRLARHLGRLGVGPESRVGVFAERGVEMVEAIHAVVRAGAAYVPLDPGNPAERLAFMAADAGLALVLVGDAVADRLPEVDAPRLLLGADRERW
ncbi:MAG TPA: condensation domain-containing protein, partial [Thermoanaerobaculia bacterium]|nr:condensation domain-containing protein [Thermoanaerobaculia bacterium]